MEEPIILPINDNHHLATIRTLHSGNIYCYYDPITTTIRKFLKVFFSDYNNEARVDMCSSQPDQSLFNANLDDTMSTLNLGTKPMFNLRNGRMYKKIYVDTLIVKLTKYKRNIEVTINDYSNNIYIRDIAKLVAEKENIPITCFNIGDKSKLLCDYNIVNKVDKKFILNGELLYNPTQKNNKGDIISQLFAKSLTGRTISLYFNDRAGNINIIDVKAQIEEKEGILIDHQRLVYKGSQLDGDKSLYDYNITNEASFNIVLRLRGGMFHESSGRNGNYNPLKPVIIDMDKYEIIKEHDEKDTSDDPDLEEYRVIDIDD